MAPVRAVLDACILIPASLRDTLLRAAAAGLFQLCWSDRILSEVQRNIVEAGLTTEQQAQSLIEVMSSAFGGAAVSAYEQLIDAMTNHAKDRHVLAAAITARAPVIVTSNLKHFPKRALAPHGIQAYHPDVFLTSLYERSPDIMVRIIRQQAADLQRPPLTPHEILVNLSTIVPVFSDVVMRQLAASEENKC